MRQQQLAVAVSVIRFAHMQVIQINAVARLRQRHQTRETGGLTIHTQDIDLQRSLRAVYEPRAPGGEALRWRVLFEILGGYQAGVGVAPALGVHGGNQRYVGWRRLNKFDLVGHGTGRHGAVTGLRC